MFSLTARRAAFSGTFLQLNAAHRDWDAAEWSKLFAVYRAFGLSRLIVQWTEGYVDLVPRIFDHAKYAGIDVVLGLTKEPEFWQRPVEVLDDLESRATAVLEVLMPLSRAKNFSGWYIGEEIDDTRWRDASAQEELLRYCRAIRKRSRHGPVTISAFANGSQPPGEYAEFLRRLVRKGGIARVLFQDSIGARKLTLDALPAYYAALRKKLGRRVAPIVEIFDQTRDNPFEAKPASVQRIEKQLQIARQAGYPLPLVFSLPEYSTPELLSRFRVPPLPVSL